jgi:uncharacterized protein YuzE
MKSRLGFLILLFLLVLFPVSALASTWAKSYGGSASDEAYSIQQTSDGGFIVAGISYSFGAGGWDIWVLKLDANGNVVWQKTYGGFDYDYAWSIQETSDGGFIVAGGTYSFDAGGIKCWILKLDANGNVTWSKTFYSGIFRSIQEMSDGGFIVAGVNWSTAEPFWVLKLDAKGNVAWQKGYKGPQMFDSAESIQQTSDGGFIVGGETYTSVFGTYYSCNWVLKLDVNGNVVWQKTYGCSDDVTNSIRQTSDGGFIVAGNNLVLKLDANGNVIWQKKYDGSGAGSIQETSDGGFIAAGNLVLKLDANGNVTWSKTCGGSFGSIQETSDGGFIVAGDTKSFGAGESDFWILKLDENGNIPGCDFVQDISVICTNTSVIPVTTGAILEVTASTVTNTAVEPINTDATVEEQCFYMEALDLVYTPVTPCRIVDTRIAGGAIPPGGIRSYNVRGDVASQGGNVYCPSPKGEPYTAHINVTVVPLGNGNIVTYPYGSTAPNASLVNYRADAQNIANSGTVKTCFNCGKDIFIKSRVGTAHVVIDVLGYDFAKP